jgi:adenylate kinase
VRVAVTGTPGTGKTTATDLVESDLRVIHLNDLVKAEGLYAEVDEDRDSVIADVEAVRERLAHEDDVIVDSHLAHLVDADRVVVLRCAPDQLRERLLARGDSEAKAAENAEAESLDVILAEAVERHGLERVYEIDTTDRVPEAVAREIERVIAGDRDPSAGEVDFMEAP